MALQTETSEGIFDRLTEKYRQLEEQCYRTAVSQTHRAGRFQRAAQRNVTGHELAKKIDLDHALSALYAKFFPEA